MQTHEIAHHAVRSNSGSRVFVETPGKVGPFRLLPHLVKDLRMTGWLKGLTRDIHAHNTITRHLLMRQPTPSIYYPPRYIPPSFLLPRRTSTNLSIPNTTKQSPKKRSAKTTKIPKTLPMRHRCNNERPVFCIQREQIFHRHVAQATSPPSFQCFPSSSSSCSPSGTEFPSRSPRQLDVFAANLGVQSSVEKVVVRIQLAEGVLREQHVCGRPLQRVSIVC